jgi:hypothetical protein
MKTYLEIAQIISAIKYTRHNGTWKVKLGMVKDTERRDREGYTPGVPYLQIAGEEGGEKWTGRKWQLSYHMTTTEIVHTAFKAIHAAEEHEMREFFTYKDVPVVHPHIDVDYVVERWVAGHVKLDGRPDAMEGA